MLSQDARDTRERLRGLADDPVSPAHQERMMMGVRRRVERNEGMKRRYRRAGALAAGTVVLVVAMLFVPISHTISVGSVVTAEWQVATIDLSTVSGLQNVTTLTIGIEGGNGLIYVDDIWLKP